MILGKTVIKNLFSKPVTTQYPLKPRQYPERTRGHIGIDIDTCVFCGLCSKKCPTGAITVNRADKTWTIERFGCIQCGYCVESCNKNSLSMLQEYTQPGAAKKEDTYTQQPKKEENV
jgi:ech hydrogenase subunit F